MKLLDVKEKIDNAKNILLSAHENPDGDALGSVLAMKFMIEKYDKTKNVKILINEDLPKYMKYFKESELIEKSIDDNFEIDLLLILDTANKERIAINDDIFNRAKVTLNVDHHISNKLYADFNYVEDISSVSELMFKFIDVFNIELDKQMASFMYLGIVNDTGNFRHPNVTKNTFLVAAELISTGINASEIGLVLFSKSINKAKIFGDALLNSTYVENERFMYFYLPYEKILKNNYTKEDSDGASEVLLTIDGVDVSLFLREEEDGFKKGSLRSRTKVDVNYIASFLNGGGHIKAAGFKTDKSEDEIIKIILEKVKEQTYE